MKLYKRDIFSQIEPYIGDETIIVLHGARQVGKTHILKYIQNWLEERGKKSLYYDLEYSDTLDLINHGTTAFINELSGKKYIEGEEIYVLIDEIQYLDNPSSFLKIIADHYKNIHLIVSGSSTFDIKTKFTNSLAGRTTPFEVFPLSFSEFLTFKESEYHVTRQPSSSAIHSFTEYYQEFIKYGGYPKVVLEPIVEKKKRYLIQMIDTYIRKDIRDLTTISDIRKFNSMLKILASQSGQLLSMKALSNETDTAFTTIQKYLSILEETYIIKLVSPYSHSASVEISKNPKIYFYDSGLLSILWLNNFQDTIIGNVFETNIFSELVKLYGRQNIHFWRTKSGKEIDFILELPPHLIPIEVKTNFQQYSSKHLAHFTAKYKSEPGKVVALLGNPKNEHYLYPWQLINIFPIPKRGWLRPKN